MKKNHLKQVASSSGEYIHNNSSDAIFIATGTCSKLYMRIIQSLEDPDLSAQLQPCCTACGHRGSVTDAKYLRQNKYLITDLLQKLKGIQCGSKEVTLRLVSSEAMPQQLDRSNVAIFSDNLRQNYIEAYHGFYLENTKLKWHLNIAEHRIKKLKDAQRAAHLPFKGVVV